MSGNAPSSNSMENHGLLFGNLEDSNNIKVILETIPSPVALVNAQGKLLYVNRHGYELCGIDYSGCDMDEHISKVKALRLDGTPFPPEEMPVTRILKYGKAVRNVEMIIQNVKGARYPVNVSAAPLLGADGTVSGAIATFEDFTERKRAEQALRESEQRLRALTVASADVVYRMSADWSTMTELYGKGFLPDTEEPNPQWLDKYIHPEDHDFVNGVIRECIREKRMFELEHRVLRADGSIGWTYSRAVPMMNALGEITEWFGAASDVTERRRAEETLFVRTRELEEVNRQKTDILESISDCFYALDKDLRFTYVNKAAEEIWGMSRADLIGRKIEDVFTGLIDISLSKFHKALGERISQHYEVYSKVAQRWGDMSVYPTGDGISVIFRDNTERKLAEEALRESGERQEYLLKLSDALRPLSGANSIQKTASRILAEHLKVSQANYAEYHEDLGYSVIRQENLIGADTGVMGMHKFEDFSFLVDILRTGSVLTISDVLLFPDIPEDQRERLNNLGFRAHLSVPLIKEDKLAATLTVRQVAPREWTRQEISFLHETAERTWAAVERARAEEALNTSEAYARTLADALEKKNRLVTDFFINISHEFKTPLTILMLGMELLEAKAKMLNGGDAFAGNLAAMKQNSYRLSRLVSNLLDITKLDAGFMQPKWEEADAAALLRNLAHSVKTYARQRQLSLQYECEPDVIPFTTDGFMLERIALNLLSNAIKHTPAGGRISIACRKIGRGISIAVSDTGEGIPDDKKTIIFDRFTQVDTRMTRASEGTGIGLALTKSLVELLGGRISVESTPGAGSTFTVELPFLQRALSDDTIEKSVMQIDKRVQMELSDIIIS